MRTPPEISVVINNFNYARFLPEAIESALNQTRKPAEIILVDDGSTDGSQDFVKSAYGSRVTLIESANFGQLNALKLGITAASSPFVALLDADDRWRPDHLSAVAEVLHTNPEVNFVIANNTKFGDAEGIGYSITQNEDYGYTTLAGLTREWLGAPTSCLVIAKQHLQFLNALPQGLMAKWKTRADDVIIYGAAISGARKYRLAKPTVEYRIHGKNLFQGQSRAVTKSAAYEEQREELLRALNEHAFPGLNNAQIIARELSRNTLRKYRNRRNLVRSIWASHSTFLSRLRLTTAVYFKS